MHRADDFFIEFEERMRARGESESAIRSFRHSYEALRAGGTGLIPEKLIDPVSELPRLEDVSAKAAADPKLFEQTLVVKLNGGLGTSMGLEHAKSLIRIKNDLTFLDLIVRQVLHLRTRHGVHLRFLLMNSFSTRRDTLDFLRRYPDLGKPSTLELLQNSVPKVEAATLRPVRWAADPQLEWCPPGHGDLYPSLLESGWLKRLLADGVQFMFVSNSDNLGATLDPGLLSWFAQSRLPFVMEVAERTAADRKGGHLARRGGRFLLRESAQCPEDDSRAFQDIGRHRFFNTNNLWLRLDRLDALLKAGGGFVPLPLIRNSKPVDPRDRHSPAVFQLETAMGAAIESFPDSGAIVVPRSRFAPVKTTSDLLTLRSDAYAVSEDWRMLPARPEIGPPVVHLDPEYYKLLEQLEQNLSEGVPSLCNCRELKVRGNVRFRPDNVFRGKVEVVSPGAEPRSLPAGEYSDRVVQL